MNILFIFASLLFGIWILRNILFWVYLWQLKEYRFDRLLVHLKETIQGRRIVTSPLLFLTWFSIFSYLFVVSHDFVVPYQLLVIFVFSLKVGGVIKEFREKSIKKPVLTLKVIGMLLSVTIAIFILYIFPLVDRFLWLLLLERCVPILITLLVILLSVPTEFYRDIKLEKAVKKIKDVKAKHTGKKSLLVIAVTGSYGKSSTKDFIAQILSKRFRVLKTSGTQNTPIGITNTILSGLKNTTEIFIVEMGAYKKREIAELCDIVSPQIGVLTGVSDQHLSLFGSIENIMNAKYELIESLPQSGLAIFNGNNKNAWALYKRTRKKKVLYQWGENLKDLEKNLPSDFKNSIYAYNISVKKTHITFDVMLKNKTIHFKTYLIGGQTIENVLPAIYIAHYLGMNENQIKKAVVLLSGLPKTMRFHKIPNGPSVIDDTFNANPAAVTVVIDYMKQYKGKKILVLHPMIELGRNAAIEHYRVGRQVSRVCDYILLTNKNFSNDILKGIQDEGGRCNMIISNVADATQFITAHTGEDDIVVFEGKEADNVLQKVL